MVKESSKVAALLAAVVGVLVALVVLVLLIRAQHATTAAESPEVGAASGQLPGPPPLLPATPRPPRRDEVRRLIVAYSADTGGFLENCG